MIQAFRNLALFSTILLISSMVNSQSNIEIPLGKTLDVEVPIEYTFKAGTEYVNKTVYAKLRIENLKVIHKPIKQFVGKSMGIMDDEISVTHWFTYTPPSGVSIDGEFIPFSSFTQDYGTFHLRDAYFTWTQGSSTYKDFNVSATYLKVNPTGDTPGYTFNIHNITKIVGTETKQQAFDIVKDKGELRGNYFRVEQLEWNPSYDLKNFLQKRDEQIALETGYYTVNGFKNKVKQNAAQNNNINENEKLSENKSNSTNTTEQPELPKTGTSTNQQNEMLQKQKEQNAEQLVNAVAPAVVTVFSYLGEILPPTTFFTMGLTYRRSNVSNGIVLEGGPGWKLTPQKSTATLAIAPNLVMGVEKRRIPYPTTVTIDLGSTYNNTKEVQAKANLINDFLWGLGGNLYFDHAKFQKWGLNFAWSFSIAQLDLEPFDEQYKNEHIVGKNLSPGVSFFRATRIELIRVLGDVNNNPVAISLGIGFENNKYVYGNFEERMKHAMFQIRLFCL